MRCLEVIMVENAKASGISIQENQRIAKEGQYIIRTYSPKLNIAPETKKGSSGETLETFQLVVGLWQSSPSSLNCSAIRPR